MSLEQIQLQQDNESNFVSYSFTAHIAIANDERKQNPSSGKGEPVENAHNCDSDNMYLTIIQQMCSFDLYKQKSVIN